LRKPARRRSVPVAPPKEDIYALEVSEQEDEAGYVEEAELPVPEESMMFVQDDGYDGALAFEEPSEAEQISSPTRRRTSRMSDRHSHVEPEEEVEEEELPPVIPSTKKKGRPAKRSLPMEDVPASSSSRVAQKPAQRQKGKAQLRSTKQPQQVEESTISIDESVIDPSLEEIAPPRPTTKAKGKGRSRQLPTPEETQPTADDPIETTELDDSYLAPPPPPEKRGKPGPKRKLAVYTESEVDAEEIPEVEEATSLEPAPKRTKKPAKRGRPPKERDSNIMPPPSFTKPSIPSRAGSTAPSGARWDESMWASSRNMSRLRDPTPSAEAMVGRTRSGRQVIKPLNHFANERAQYGRDGTLLAVQTAETVEKPSHANGRARSRAPSKAPGRGVSRRRPALEEIGEEAEDEDAAQYDDMEDWEARGEMIYGEVNDYDVLTGLSTNDTFETGIFPPFPFTSENC
jgi:centromere protein C